MNQTAIYVANPDGNSFGAKPFTLKNPASGQSRAVMFLGGTSPLHRRHQLGDSADEVCHIHK